MVDVFLAASPNQYPTRFLSVCAGREKGPQALLATCEGLHLKRGLLHYFRGRVSPEFRDPKFPSAISLAVDATLLADDRRRGRVDVR